MLNFNKFKNQNILIYGYGKSGKASVNYLKKNNYLRVYDDKKVNISKKYLINKVELNKIKFDYVLISPGIDKKKCSLKKFLFKNSKKIISELDIFYLSHPKNIKITITGTNGKSTTSKLLYEVLKKKYKDIRLAGNIGRPLLLERKVNKNTIFVIEASSYQIEYSKYFKTDYAVILNISPDHLERHGSLNNYIKAKFKLFKNQTQNGYAFIDPENKLVIKELKKNKIQSKVIKVNLRLFKKFKVSINNFYFDDLNNINNLKFVLEISRRFKVKKNKIIDAINSFKGLNYRQQVIYKNKKLLIMNDSKSTSFSSSLNILKSYKNIFWIVGGQYKKGDKLILNKKYYKNIHAYIFGKKKNFFINHFKKKIKYKFSKNIENSLNQIIKDVKKNNIFPINIIFSPSAASFDQFKNFEERGKKFNFLLKKLKLIKKINAKY